MAADAACDYCGLPLSSDAGRPANGPAAGAAHGVQDGVQDESRVEPRYCCYGCRFAAGVTQASGDSAQARWLMTRLGLAVFFTMNVMVFTLVLWSQEGDAAEGAAAVYHGVARHLCLLFSTPVMLLLAGPLVAAAWDELRAGRPSLNLLLAAGVFAAYLYSVGSVLLDAGHVYFEVACMVLVFVTLGRWFEASGKLRTTAALRALEQLLPERVRLVRDGRQIEADRREVRPGDTVRVLAGERVPVDGRLVRNRGSVDEQAITGESLPVVKEPGDDLFAGTLNLDGDLWIVAVSAADAGLIARLIDAVTRAATDREPYQRLAARISARFVPLVAAIAVATFAWHAWRTGWEAAVLNSLSVAVIACPCALGLATPMALWAALGRAAQARILIQEGDALSRLAEADAICFDKTGTLSTGSARLQSLIVDPRTPEAQVWSVVESLADASNHPLATALGRAARERRASGDGAAPVESPAGSRDVATLPGLGVRGVPNGLGRTAWLGSSRLMAEAGQRCDTLAETAARIEREAAAPQCQVGWDGRVRGIATFDEQFRPQAAETLDWFARIGWSVAVLTGDRRPRGDRLARQWNAEVRSELMPTDKLEAIRAMRAAGRRVVMVGDGINDAPALAAADVGVALGCGADVSRHSAAVCLLGDDLRLLPWLVTLARQTSAAIRWNLLWAFAYNAIGIGVAAVGWLNPIVAAVAMVVSSLLVVSNSLRLGALPLPDELSATEAVESAESAVESPVRDSARTAIGAADSSESSESSESSGTARPAGESSDGVRANASGRRGVDEPVEVVA